jgi:hypothetical protein
MTLRITDMETEALTAQVADLTGETCDRAIKTALQERKDGLTADLDRERRFDELRRYLAEEVWPHIPADVLGKPISRAEWDALLGYGPDGY